MRPTIWLAMAIISTALASGCKPSSSTSAVQTVVSPDGQIEAVVLETNGGATTSYGYPVELRKPGDQSALEVAALYGAQRNEGAYGVNVRWTQLDALHVEYLRAKNVVLLLQSAKIDGHLVSVSLDSGVLDLSAGNGSMAGGKRHQ